MGLAAAALGFFDLPLAQAPAVRVGGAVVNSEAIKLMKFAVS